jgi:hypothetical protein
MGSSYSSRLITQSWNDGKSWARDNILWASVMVVLPPVAVYLRDPNRSIEWVTVKTTLWLYLAVLVVYVAVYLVKSVWKLDKERAEALEVRERENQVLKREVKKEAEKNNISHADWRNISEKFNVIVPLQLSAQYQTSQGCTVWTLYDAQCKALCTLAGTMLVSSTTISPHLSDEIRAELNPVSRWLEYLKATTNAASYRKEYFTEEFPSGEKTVHLLGRIDNVPRESVAACIKCSAQELAR